MLVLRGCRPAHESAKDSYRDPAGDASYSSSQVRIEPAAHCWARRSKVGSLPSPVVASVAAGSGRPVSSGRVEPSIDRYVDGGAGCGVRVMFLGSGRADPGRADPGRPDPGRDDPGTNSATPTPAT